jgi:outer membrane protein TolC
MKSILLIKLALVLGIAGSAPPDSPGGGSGPASADQESSTSGRLQEVALPAQPPPETAQDTSAPPPTDEDIYFRLQNEVLDPLAAEEFIDLQLQDPDASADEKRYFQVARTYMRMIDRPQELQLSLDQAVRLALEHSYNIEVQSFNPAISTTQVVEAEAAFDTVFAARANFNEANSPAFSALAASDSSTRTFDVGLNKLLPTGAVVSAGWNVLRQERDLQFDAINPVYFDDMHASLRQPLLRGFGLDYNRSAISISRINRRISGYEFERQVQDHLVNVERTYWQLVVARRNIVIRARLITEFQRTYDYLYARKDFDATQVEITDAKSRLDAQIASYADVLQEVFDTEDRLKGQLNAPDLNLIDDIEIIPTEFMNADGVVVDRFAELEAALEHRQELKQAELAIESARIFVGQAKNETLPRFDLTLSYSYDALGVSFHDAWQNLSDLDFHTYVIGLEFEVPIGNRGPQSRLKRARLEHDRAVTQLKLSIETILEQVNTAIRTLQTSYQQIATTLQTVESFKEQVKAIEDRAERRDPDQLNRELNARQNVASSRQALLNVLAEYNFAISGLERAKGTLLEYNNIKITDLYLDK